jgi:hypothetical protein
MGESGDEADLAEEPLRPDRKGQLGAKDLDGDLASVAQVAREIDRGHPTLADETLDLIAAWQGCAELL